MRNGRNGRHQAGMLTLGLVLVLLMVMALMTVYAARTSLLELKLSGSSYRAKQALEAAEAGLHYGVAYYLAGGADHNADGQLDMDAAGVLARAQLGGPRWQVQFCDAASLGPACVLPAAVPARLRIMATGFSDDGSARRVVSQQVMAEPVLLAVPEATLLARRLDSASGGSLEVINNQRPQTIRSGTLPALPFSTRIARDGLLDQAGSTNSSLGRDVQLADAALATLSDEAFFHSSFALGWETLKASADIHIAGHQPFPDDDMGGKVVLLSALDGQPYTRLPVRLGSPIAPVILLVDGELELAAGSVVFGVVYARKLSSHDGAKVQGAVLLEALAQVEGTLQLEYDAALLAKAQSLRQESVLASSWHDW
ncbi:polymer-forming cytoskeletal protein [Craterilacuibacter sp. RT1T]|uniref:polymer-forming cytoskeletal protein n=1 Tax=Craterilacuibacter sp. RT1T TaxID=2942211 RepID=UPI0020C0A879|nr:polymer-forming cytoskeletal protein [Craterilacuibacter sp. RT1T]